MNPTTNRVYVSNNGSNNVSAVQDAPPAAPALVTPAATWYFAVGNTTQGATALATTWNLLEGSTQAPFTEFIEILNPQPSTMSAHVDFDLPSGQVIGRDFQIGPNRPLILSVNQIVPNSPVSARITTSMPSVVERTMFMNKLGELGGTDTIGVAGS